ncbi:MarR family transcriptional regulator [Fusobacterium sp.]|uniref:MarR family transcriptional regulator n=1 Tax=Fusobacterium sp. TaxID=68766 RepID=UPI002916CB6A|nr:MarR family transcriptional regulator [Fusobacterium sp.]
MIKISNKVVKKFFNLIEDSREFYKDFLSREPKNKLIPEIYLSMKEFQYLAEKEDESLDVNTVLDLSVADYNFIYYIGSSEKINITQLSKKMKISKGYASKAIKKLHSYELIEIFQIPPNKKELFLSLTKSGTKIYLNIYKEFLKKENEIEIFLEDNFNDSELKTIFDFFIKINKFKNEKLLKNK